jgi:chromosome segregation ATPase
MSEVVQLSQERSLQADVEELRARHPKTQDLYLEVCGLLFFRYGTTPTANKLYQLVRKGSMNTPVEVLGRFWDNLREKSRVRVEHPDLPAELRDAAGEVVAQLWQRAQAQATASLAGLQAEAQSNTLAAQAASESAQGQLQALNETVRQLQEQLQAAQAAVRGGELVLASERGEAAGLRRQIEEAGQQRTQLQEAFQTAQAELRLQLEELRQALAQQREAAGEARLRAEADLNRVLLEVDHHRTLAAKARKDLEQLRRASTDKIEEHARRLVTVQEERALLSKKLGEAEGALAETRTARDDLARQLHQLNPQAVARPSARRKKPSSGA